MHEIDQKAVFNAGRHIRDPEARAEYLRQACGEDAEALRCVAELLEAHAQQLSFLEGPAAAFDATRLQERPRINWHVHWKPAEIGRGGMGVVYEAEQISLKRRVALKVLPFAAVLDNRQLQRFRTEAMAAARLHHQHIVPVYQVGCERAVHFYAMQYIDGPERSELIQQTRLVAGIRHMPTSPSLYNLLRKPVRGRRSCGAA
jgi:hypothetical protein